MSRESFRFGILVAGAAAILSIPGESDASDGSRRRVVSCNADGTYTCANDLCSPGYCCQIGGENEE
jgi:hypothetical protein